MAMKRPTKSKEDMSLTENAFWSLVNTIDEYFPGKSVTIQTNKRFQVTDLECWNTFGIHIRVPYEANAYTQRQYDVVFEFELLRDGQPYYDDQCGYNDDFRRRFDTEEAIQEVRRLDEKFKAMVDIV